MNDVEYVLPKVVIALDVLVETSLSTFAVVIENEFLDVADVADVLHVIVVSANGVSQTSKGVNNNTKDNVQTGNVDNNLETCIMYQLHQVLFFVIFVMNNCGNISDSTTHSHSFVEHSHVALEHVGAVVLSNDIRVIGIDSEIIHSILNVKEGESAVNVNDDHHQNCGQPYLCNVGSDSEHHILQNNRPIDNIQKMETVVNIAAGFAQK